MNIRSEKRDTIQRRRKLTFAKIYLTKTRFMNELENEIDRIIDVVLECCTTTHGSNVSITREELLGKGKKENANLARSILANYLYKDGVTVTTIAFIFRRSHQAVRNLLANHAEMLRTSNAYRIVNEQVKDKLKPNNSQETPK